MQLKLKFLLYKKIANLKNNKLDWKIIRDLKNENLLIIDKKISPQEQSILISEIMKHVSDNFSGIEIAILDAEKNLSLFEKMQNFLVRLISGKRNGMTIIGPANIVKKIKKNPNQLIMFIK